MSFFGPGFFVAHFLHPAPNKKELFAQLEEPIRAEIFSVERLELHAQTLAAAQTITNNPRRLRKLTPRVRENGRILLEAYHAIADAVRNQRAITPAAEWLLDNFHIIEEQIRDIRDHLPSGFYKELPKIAEGPLHGYPRVYGIAWAFVAHTDSRFDPDLLKRFVQAYQREQPLTIGELWALPVTLRMVMVENLRRLAVRIVGSQYARLDADQLADELLGLGGKPGASFESLLNARDKDPLATAFVVQLAQRFRYQDPNVNEGLKWLDAKLAGQGVSAEELVVMEHHNQAAANVTVRNIITSMRLMSAFDWQQFFEDVSIVDEILQRDPSYTALDFVTRDRYRHAIEDLARRSKLPEIEVAKAVLAKTQKMRRAMQEGPFVEDRYGDPSYYLISNGRLAFEKELGVKITPWHLLVRTYTANPTPAYLGTIFLLTLLVLSYPLIKTLETGAPLWGLIVLGLTGMFAASDISISLINRLVTKAIGPRHLPRYKFADGVPTDYRTFVVMPTLLINIPDIEELINRLEVHFLSNPEGDVYFALLTDWTDASEEHRPDDEELYEAAQLGIAALNARHGPSPAGYPRFYLFHRKRLWNAAEGKWMGWERKRGKLEEFNLLLRGGVDTTYINVILPPPQVKYVITLDSDTQVPNGAVRQLVGTLAHPLNRPRIDAHTRRVVEGYGILQPRITAALPSRRDRSIYQRLFSGPCGVDPYASAVSDLYQDLFREGNFTGKGIYDVDTFQKVMHGRVPENALLSHDLFEGIFARCALVSDISFFEEFPSHSEVAASRMHRWVRGDWQLLPWILGREGKAIPAIGRWKMLDNLRRSLLAPAMLIILIGSWVILNVPYGTWMVFILLALALPSILNFISDLVPARGVSFRNHWSLVSRDLISGASHIAVSVTLLAHHGWLMVDAITRALVRLTITRRHLLEWVTAAQAKSAASLALGAFLSRMKGAVVIGVGSGVVLFVANSPALLVAAPFIMLWLCSPLLARYISLPPKINEEFMLDKAEIHTLRLSARRIWRFFTTFVSQEDNFLPPDNFQEDPNPVVAHRTSPTNFGLYLLSVVAARQFGWIGLNEMIARLEKTLHSMETLPRFRGHFYNWYETREKRPLDPKYISSVDSGNLAGHLLALAQACELAWSSPLISAKNFSGLQDTLALLNQAVRSIEGVSRTTTVTLTQLEEAIAALNPLLKSPPDTPIAYCGHWRTLMLHADTLRDVARAFALEQGNAQNSEILNWAQLLHQDIESHNQDLDLLQCVTALEQAAADQPVQAPDFLSSAQLSAMSLEDWLDYAAWTRQKLQMSEELNPHANEAALAALGQMSKTSLAIKARLDGIAKTAKQLAMEMDFRFLFDETRKLFAIGYRVDDQCLDSGYYDLLASEARLTSFIAIAKGDVPPSHWFRLGRALTPVEKGRAILISWSGSMFEYLMPSLVMFTPHGSLLDQTCRLTVQRQIQYGAENKVPWGVSESAYQARDLAFTYQYSNFGVPGLGLKRGLGQDLVIAPYATLLAAMYRPNAAIENLKRLAELGGLGVYGYYEALDFTRTRLPEGKDVSVIKAYMAHHQGMSLLAITNVLYDGVMRRFFHNEPLVQASELLLQERTPRNVAMAPPRADQVEYGRVRDPVETVLRRYYSPRTPVPATHLLSNGRYVVMLTTAGSGYSRWQDMAVTRWREDVTRDSWGSYFFLRDTGSGQVWSVGYQPTSAEPEQYEVTFTEDRARFVRQDGAITTSMEVIVSSEDDAEIRRVSIANNSGRVREIEITSYSEVVLNTPAADAAHPAFSNLFVQTEFLPDIGCLLATRRPRSEGAPRFWACHVFSLAHAAAGIEYETDRNRFLGRNRSIANPASIMDGRPLSNTVGPVLDPIFSLRVRLRIPPGVTSHIAFSTIMAESREQIIDLADKYHDSAIFERASTLAWTQAQVQLHYLGIDPEEAHLFQHLANRLLYLDPTLRPSSEILKRNTLSASGLWPHSISGDYPIVLARIDDPDDKGIIRQLLRAHEYWRMKRLYVDLVILNERSASYAQDLQNLLEGMVRSCGYLEGDSRGGVYVLRADLLSTAERDLLQTAARAILLSRQGNLSEQVMRMRRGETKAELPLRDLRPGSAEEKNLLGLPPLEFFNGLGGFALDGREYVTYLGKGQRTPAPWINVIANPTFGFHVSESGSSYTWSENSRENQLTPWANDPVSDPPGEAFYILDEDTRDLWSPTALPIRLEATSYIAHHGFGYSRFEHLANGIYSDLVQFVPVADPLKISKLSLHNRSAQTRRLSITYYCEWVLGFSRSSNAPYIVTEIDEASGAMLARNPWHNEFGERAAFACMRGANIQFTADRTEFLGRNGSPEAPYALLLGRPLSRRVGAGLDPCCVLQTTVILNANEKKEIIVLLGQGSDKITSSNLAKDYLDRDVDLVFEETRNHWQAILQKIQIKTPERAMDLMLNGWLLYQTLVCRILARSAFYQAGGAYGFRDQLQDTMALVVAQPHLARLHILRASSRQFVEGDVQHWWHPPTGRGVRTHFSDDLVWLPYVVAHYIAVTKDTGILNEQVGFIEGPPLRPEEEDRYFEPKISQLSASVFEHCARALDRSLKVGAHGLPLIGAGDWNDGMNRVGHQGKGESVWLAWFLIATLSQFAPIARERGEERRAQQWLTHVDKLKVAVETHAWDGAWYRRAYFDDGTPLGSAYNAECRIDSIAQSWSILSGAAEPTRARRAMESVEEYLIRSGDDLILLFAPPFDKTPLDPGYIKGYLPGVRENGGQYSHAAIWLAMAYAHLGNGDRASQLFAMLNPINHACTRTGVHRYKVEPYVIAADIYAEPPHVGRGGWTWYTGSSGWMYRAGVESILGLRVRGDRLEFDPCICREWKTYQLFYQHGETLYEISVENPHAVCRGIASIKLDGQEQAGKAVTLRDDKRPHQITVTLG